MAHALCEWPNKGNCAAAVLLGVARRRESRSDECLAFHSEVHETSTQESGERTRRGATRGQRCRMSTDSLGGRTLGLSLDLGTLSPKNPRSRRAIAILPRANARPSDGIVGPAACSGLPRDGIVGPAACSGLPRNGIVGPAACSGLPRDGIDDPAACSGLPRDGIDDPAACSGLPRDGIDDPAACSTCPSDGIPIAWRAAGCPPVIRALPKMAAAPERMGVSEASAHRPTPRER
jgi:hypothetical protein